MDLESWLALLWSGLLVCGVTIAWIQRRGEHPPLGPTRIQGFRWPLAWTPPVWGIVLMWVAWAIIWLGYYFVLHA